MNIESSNQVAHSQAIAGEFLKALLLLLGLIAMVLPFAIKFYQYF